MTLAAIIFATVLIVMIVDMINNQSNEQPMNTIDIKHISKSEIQKAMNEFCLLFCDSAHLSFEEIKKKTRVQPIPSARQILMFMLYKRFKPFGETYQSVADIFGKDHATVMHAIRQVNSRLDVKDKVTIEIFEKTKHLLEIELVIEQKQAA